MESNEIGRRGFVKAVLAFLSSVMGVVIGLPAIGYLISPATKSQKSEAWIPAGSLDGYPVGSPTLFSYTRSVENGWEKTVNSYGVYILRTEDNQVKVFSNICTHLSCRITWKDDMQAFVCPCHDAHFNQDGTVASGPPPEPLHVYETKQEDGVLHLRHLEA
jgi:menaquinol-cytochrome c reductase iron-sulfur subunit